MIITADEVGRSLKGTVALLNHRPEGLSAFDLSERGFWRSFVAVWLTLPAYIVSLALERMRLGLSDASEPLLGNFWIDLVVALAHVASFVALPVATIFVVRGMRLATRYAPFVIVTNWISVAGLLVLSVPAILLLAGWATPALATLFTLAFAVIVFRVQWFATRVTLGVSPGFATGIVMLGIILNGAIATIMRGVLS